MNQSDEFFRTLAEIIYQQASATLIATTVCGHIAMITINAGKIQSIRYHSKTGSAALEIFKRLEIKSFSRKDSIPCQRPHHNSLSTQDILIGLIERLLHLGNVASPSL